MINKVSPFIRIFVLVALSILPALADPPSNVPDTPVLRSNDPMADGPSVSFGYAYYNPYVKPGYYYYPPTVVVPASNTVVETKYKIPARTIPAITIPETTVTVPTKISTPPRVVSPQPIVLPSPVVISEGPVPASPVMPAPGVKSVTLSPSIPSGGRLDSKEMTPPAEIHNNITPPDSPVNPTPPLPPPSSPPPSQDSGLSSELPLPASTPPSSSKNQGDF